MRWIVRTESADDARDQDTTPLRGDATAPCGKHVDIVIDDLLSLVASEERPAPPGRPWILLNMVTSIDGATRGPEGKSRSLSSDADRALFLALRGIADVVLSGASTVRVENYGAPVMPKGAAQVRAERDQAPLPHMAVASASLRLDPDARFFREAPADQRPIVLTTREARQQVAATNPRLPEVANLLDVGESTVSWPEAFRRLYDELGARVVLVEGGPTINSQVAASDLVDEICLTVAPLLVGGTSRRIVGDARIETPTPMRLGRVLEDDDALFLRYIRR